MTPLDVHGPSPVSVLASAGHGADAGLGDVGIDLDALADLVAAKVVGLLTAVPPVPAEVGPLAWTPADVARELGRSVEWVRDHRHELGVLPAEGPRPRLMFDPSAVRAWATARDVGVRSEPTQPASALAPLRQSRPRMSTGVDLLPIRGDRRAA